MNEEVDDNVVTVDAGLVVNTAHNTMSQQRLFMPEAVPLQQRHDTALNTTPGPTSVYNRHFNDIVRLLEGFSVRYPRVSAKGRHRRSEQPVFPVRSHEDTPDPGPENTRSVELPDATLRDCHVARSTGDQRCDQRCDQRAKGRALSSGSVEITRVDMADSQVVRCLLKRVLQQIDVLDRIIAVKLATFTSSIRKRQQVHKHSFRMHEMRNFDEEKSADTMPDVQKSLLNVQQQGVYLQQVIRVLAEELRRGQHLSLIKAVQLQNERQEEITTLKKTALTRISSIKSIREKMKELNEESTEERDRNKTGIYRLKDLCEETVARTGMEVRTMERISAARLEGSRRQQGRQLQRLRQLLEERRVQRVAAIRRDEEQQSSVKKHLQSLEQQTEEWQRKFNRDITAMDENLATLRIAKEENERCLRAIKSTHCRYQAAIAEDEERERERHMNLQQNLSYMRAAVVIQAWWRGLVVRRHLYRKKRTRKNTKLLIKPRKD